MKLPGELEDIDISQYAEDNITVSRAHIRIKNGVAYLDAFCTTSTAFTASTNTAIFSGLPERYLPKQMAINEVVDFPVVTVDGTGGRGGITPTNNTGTVTNGIFVRFGEAVASGRYFIINVSYPI